MHEVGRLLTENAAAIFSSFMLLSAGVFKKLKNLETHLDQKQLATDRSRSLT